MNVPRGPQFRAWRERLQATQEGFAAAAGVKTSGKNVFDRTIISGFENLDLPGRHRSAKATEGQLVNWFKCYENYCRRSGRHLDLTPEEVRKVFSGIEGLWQRNRSLDRRLTHVAYWGDSPYHFDSAAGARAVAVALGLDYDYKVCRGKAKVFVHQIATPVRRRRNLLVELPPGPGIVKQDGVEVDPHTPVLDAVTASLARKAGSSAQPFRVGLVGAPFFSRGAVSVTVDQETIGRKVAAEIALLARGPTTVFAYTTGGTPVTKLRYLAMKRELKKVVPHARVRHSLLFTSTLHRAESDLEPALKLAEALIAKKERVVFAPLFSGGAEVLSRMVPRWPRGQYMVSTDLAQPWIRIMAENHTKWTATVAFDPILLGAVAVAAVERFALAAEGLVPKPASEEVVVPTATIHSKVLHKRRWMVMDEVRGALLKDSGAELVANYGWLHFVPGVVRPTEL